VKILETEGPVVGIQLEYDVFENPLRKHKLSIGTEDKTKFTNIRDY